jgi:hypothetical protein
MIVRRLVGVTAAAVLLLGVGVSTGSAQAKQPERVTVCHNGDDGVKAITVAEKAVPAIVANGGGLPGEPAGEGFTYGEDCALVPVKVCHEALDNGADLQYFGVIDTFGNAFVHSTDDGTCTGGVDVDDVTIVSAASVDEALAKCAELGSLYNLFKLTDYYASVPDNQYGC